MKIGHLYKSTRELWFDKNAIHDHLCSTHLSKGDLFMFLGNQIKGDMFGTVWALWLHEDTKLYLYMMETTEWFEEII